VIRAGLPGPVLRQGWAPLAVRPALGGGRMDLARVHCGEDSGRAAAGLARGALPRQKSLGGYVASLTACVH